MSAQDTPAAPDAEPDQALAAAGEAGIRCMAIPTPFLVGRVNCFLIDDDPLTLIDTGPNSAKSLDELETALHGLGHRIEDIGLIVITHQHLDHLGLLEILARRSGAEVAAFALLGPYLEDFGASAVADDDFATQVMLRHGVPAELTTALGAVGRAFQAFGSGAPVTVPLRDGDELALRDRKFQIQHRPGHSPSDTLLWDDERQLLIGGDHLLARISSNPLITRPLSADSGSSPGGVDRPQALIDYIASLRSTRELPVGFVLGGHGPPVTNHSVLIDERLRMHERRARKVLALLGNVGPSSAYGLASQMWGNVAVTQAYLTISEVLGHLDLLIADGLVREDTEHSVTRFAAL